MSYLTDYEEIDEGYVAFGGNPKGGKITGKGSTKTGKFDGSDKVFFVGYSLNSKSFRVFNSRTRNVEENLHIRFSKNTQNVVGSGPEWLFDIDALTRTMNYEPIAIDLKCSQDDGFKPSSDDGKKVDKDPNMPALEYVGTFDFSNKDENDDVVADMNNLDTIIQVSPSPTTRIHKDHPLDQEELLQFKFQEVWTLVDLLNKKRAIGTKWVFRNKNDERRIMIRNKARLVAQGYIQEEGIDYDEVFSPFARIKAIRLFLAYASFKGFVVYQMDVKSAFLYGKIEEEVKELCNEFERLMYEKFQMSYMGELTFFLGLQNESTHIETQKPLLKDKDDKEVDVYMYRSMIGSLMYLTSSRPDIMFVVCACARYQVNPKVTHLLAVKRIFRYLKGQPKLGIRYLKDSPFDLVAYIDNDYAGASLDSKSTIKDC
nr:hypothetical protein [Tanacetum cinerariifolium]